MLHILGCKDFDWKSVVGIIIVAIGWFKLDESRAGHSDKYKLPLDISDIVIIEH